jgi:hypothetical protein
MYFPDATAQVALHSFESNEQHNPGQALHWNRAKSSDEMDAMCRHIVDGTSPTLTLDEQILEQRAVAWRAMAQLQKLCEQRDENSNSQKFAAGEEFDGWNTIVAKVYGDDKNT